MFKVDVPGHEQQSKLYRALLNAINVALYTSSPLADQVVVGDKTYVLMYARLKDDTKLSFSAFDGGREVMRLDLTMSEIDQTIDRTM